MVPTLSPDEAVVVVVGIVDGALEGRTETV
jgi:hypothetical protein